MLEFATVAVNCNLPPVERDPVAGLTVTVIAGAGFTVIVAVADFVGSALEVAFTVTCCELETEDGAVYIPAVDIVPTDGLIDQVTAVLVVPVILADRATLPPTPMVAVVGETAIVTALGGVDGGDKVTAEDATLEPSATDVAVIVTVCAAEIDAGAVYRPEAVSVPTEGDIVHVAPVWELPVTVAVN